MMTRHRRNQDGATTAEYVGIVAFVALFVTTVFAFVPQTSDAAGHVVSKAFCTIGAPFGFAGCANDDLPGYVPTNCTVSSHEGRGGGSVTVIAEVKGDSGYTLTRERERQDDGTFKDKYVVKTMGQLGGGYEFNLGGGVDADTGSGHTSVEASGKAKIEGDVTWGSTYEFSDEESAKNFIDKFKDQFGEFGGDVDGAPSKASTYYELGAKGTVSGEAGPLSGDVSQGVVLGLEQMRNGDKKVKMALSLEGALELGIPVPKTLIEASAHGKISGAVVADVTFDKSGKVASLGGQVQFTAQGSAGVGFDTEPWTKHGKHEKKTGNDLENIDLPSLEASGGKLYELNFSTDFRREDGSYDYGAIDALSSQLGSYISGSGGMSPAQAAALKDQINQHSQVTFNSYDYDEEETKYGASGKFLFIKVGAEGHMVTVDQNLTDGYYYDPVQGLWADNVVCSS